MRGCYFHGGRRLGKSADAENDVDGNNTEEDRIRMCVLYLYVRHRQEQDALSG